MAEEFAVLSRTCRAPDRMAVGQKKGREPAANDARRASQEDSRHEMLSAPIGARASPTSSEARQGFRRASLSEDRCSPLGWQIGSCDGRRTRGDFPVDLLAYDSPGQFVF
jgi:hypothetical protein